MGVKLRGALFQCGRCRNRYSNPFGHTCVTRLDRKGSSGKTKVAVKLGLSAGKCGRCHKPVGNPITHQCTTRTDFKQRTAQAKKDAAAAKRKARPQHPKPSACGEAECQRAACAAYKEGRERGYEEGYEVGYEDGYGAGFAAGYAAGAASAG
jgi:hypothetical protein